MGGGLTAILAALLAGLRQSATDEEKHGGNDRAARAGRRARRRGGDRQLGGPWDHRRHRRFGLHLGRRERCEAKVALRHQGFRAQARQRGSNGQKARRVLAGRKVDADGMVRAIGLAIFAQAFAEPVGLHANDGIALLVEIGGAPERIHGDVIFLDLLGSAFETT